MRLLHIDHIAYTHALILKTWSLSETVCNACPSSYGVACGFATFTHVCRSRSATPDKE